MRAFIDKYDIFFFDLWGVIYDGKKIHKNTKKVLKLIKEKKKKIVIVSNSSKTKSEIFSFLKKKNLNANLINDIFTSGDFAKKKILNEKKRVIPIDGISKKNIEFLKRLNMTVVKNFDDANLAIAVTVNKNFSHKKIIKNLEICRKKKLKLFCINPDFRILNSHYGMGYYYNKYLNLGGKGEYYGKPNPKFYKYICQKLKILNKKKILFIGDTIYNDIIGANNIGIDSLLVKKSKLYKFKIKNFKMIALKNKEFLNPKYAINDLKIFN